MDAKDLQKYEKLATWNHLSEEQIQEPYLWCLRNAKMGECGVFSASYDGDDDEDDDEDDDDAAISIVLPLLLEKSS